MKPDIFYQDPSFDITSPEKYILSIRLSSDGFSFLLLDTYQNKFVTFLSYNNINVKLEANITETWGVVFENYSWLKEDFKSVHVFVENQYTTLIPITLFNNEKLEEYLKFNLGKIGEDVKYDAIQIKQISAYQVFAYPSFYESLLNQTLREYKMIHFSVPMIESLLIKNKNKIIGKKVFLHVRNNYIDIVILEEDGLLFYNTFEYVTQEDLLYYLLYVFENQKLNPEEVPLVITGNIEKTSQVFELIKTYIRNISFGARIEAFSYSYLFDTMPKHQQAYLFDAFLCGFCDE